MTEKAHHSAAHKPARALATHIDAISFAVTENNAIIDDTSENQSLIKSLSKAGLGYYVTELSGLNLNAPVVQFIRHFEQQKRFHVHGGEVAALFGLIEESAEFYRLARHKSPDDGDLFRRQLRDQVNELAGALLALSNHFSGAVYEQLRLIADLDLRILANERTLAHLTQLNDTLSGLSTPRLEEIGAREPELERLLFCHLRPIIDACRQDTIDAVHRLREDLLQWKKDRQAQQINHLLDGLSRHFKRYPNYLPDEALLMTAPAPFYHTGLNLNAYADFNHPEASEHYFDVTQKILQIYPRDKGNQPALSSPPAVKEITETVEETLSPFDEAILTFFDALQRPDGKTRLRASEAFTRLKPNSDLETWLIALAVHYRDHQDQFSPSLKIIYHETALPHYNGNFWVTDLDIAHDEME